jgi:hypothetical protein
MLQNYNIAPLLEILHNVKLQEAIEFMQHILLLFVEWLLIRESLNHHKSVQRLVQNNKMELYRRVISEEGQRLGTLCIYRKAPLQNDKFYNSNPK